MTKYDKNLNLIKAKYPHLLKELNKTGVNNGVVLETCCSRTGLPVLRVTKNERKNFLNSAYDPVLDAERWAERRAGNGKSALVLCGGGFLYHLKALLKQGRYKKVVCYEPSPVILKACLQEIDLTEIKGDFLLLSGNSYNECAILINDFLLYLMLDSDWAVLPTYQELFPTEIKSFENALRDSVRITRANLATANLFGEKWASNAINNLPVITNSPGVKHFFNQFSGVPAVIVSAGPSLEKNIHLLNEIKEKAVIICAGTSIRAMLKFGVKPHFLVAFDGTDYNKTIYSNLDLDDICLIYNYRFNHEALSLFKGKKTYMKLDIESFSDFLSLKCGYEFGAVRSGFSVAHPSLDLAVKLGCSPVILIGQDLAYTDDKRYAESQFQYVVDKKKLPAGYFLTKDLDGQDIVTDVKLDSFRQLFELMVAEYYQGKKIFNATQGGQPIKGAPNFKLADLINQYCGKERGTSRKIDELYDSGLKEIQRYLSKNKNLVREIRTLSEQGVFKVETLIDKVQQLKKRNFSQASETELSIIANEYGSLVTRQEWRLFLKDLHDWKIAPIEIAIANLKNVETKEAFDTKAQYWINICGETKKYLEYVIGQLAVFEAKQGAEKEQAVPSIVEIASSINPEQIRERIRNGGRLNDIKAELEGIINRGNRKDLREFIYWHGLILFRQKECQKAVLTLEKAVKNDRNDAKSSFLLYRCYRMLGKYTKTQECLDNCLRLGFKPDFCRRMLVKNAYRSKDYVSANNFIIDFKASLGEQYLFRLIRIDCLQQLQLHTEARTESEALKAKPKVRQGLRERLERSLSAQNESDYERNYRLNEAFFKKKGVTTGTYDEVNLKYCSYLGNEYIYNKESQRILLAVTKTKSNNLQFSTNDTLLIYNTDDSGIYHQLKRISRESSTEIKQSLSVLPIFIIEHQLTNWQMMMQQFDFNELAEFKNIHFVIGVSDEDLEQLFIIDTVPLPNVFYGTGLNEIKQLLENVKDVKEREYQRRSAALREYYHQAKPEQLNKVLIVTSIKEELLLKYGKVLQLYLKERGFETILDYEKPPYYKFNKYADLNLLERFRPDLVIHLFAVAEELEAYQGLALPFISWRIFDRWLDPNVVSDYLREKVLISGESRVNSSLIERGFHIKTVLLPYVATSVGEVAREGKADEIAIVKDLSSHERILQALTGSVMGMLTSEKGFTGEEIIAICRSIFFKLVTGLLNQSSLAPGIQFYQNIVAEEFRKENRVLAVEKLQLIAGLFQRELEDSLLTTIQAKWLINHVPNLSVKLYGSGWENEINLKTYQEASLKIGSEEYQRVVLQSKINIYPSLMWKNNSYWQPDLINGIAMGGFYLVNGSLVDTVGEKVLKPFAGLLETYRNREELLEKVAYFLKNETERKEKSGRLQEHILKNFGIDRVAKVIFEAYQEIG